MSENFKNSEENQKKFNPSQHRTKNKVQTENNSGQGSNSKIPNEVANKFNWGACILGLLWGIGNKTFKPFLLYIAFSIFASILIQNSSSTIKTILNVINIIIAIGVFIYFGRNGNSWAWKNKRWKSINDFHRMQKRWAINGIIIVILLVLLSFFGLYAHSSEVKDINRISINQISDFDLELSAQKALIAEIKTSLTMGSIQLDNNNLYYSSEEIARIYHIGHHDDVKTGNTANCRGYQIVFYGDGYCTQQNKCYVKAYKNNKYVLTININVVTHANGWKELSMQENY